MQPSLCKYIHKCKCSTSTEGSLSHKIVSWHTNSSHTSWTKKTFLRHSAQTNARSMSFNWCKPVCEMNGSPQKTACLYPKGSLLHPKLLWEKRDNTRSKAIWAEVLVSDTERSKSHDCWVTNCTSLHKLSATLPSNTLSSFWCWAPLMKLSQRRHNLAFIYFRGFLQLELFRVFWARNPSASKSNKERKKKVTGDEVRSYIWNDNVQGVLIYSSWKKGRVSKKWTAASVSGSDFKEAGIVKRDSKSGRAC